MSECLEGDLVVWRMIYHECPPERRGELVERVKARSVFVAKIKLDEEGEDDEGEFEFLI